ncbi:MAG: hypothetical protein AAGA70_14285 [Pseudomonadota bacterium]
MTRVFSSISAHLMLLVGTGSVAIGLTVAIPHMAWAYHMGVSLCATGASATSPIIFALKTGHCWGCPVALVGAAMVALALRHWHRDLARGSSLNVA